MNHRQATTTLTFLLTVALTVTGLAKEPREGIATERTAVYFRNHTSGTILLGNVEKFEERTKNMFSGKARREERMTTGATA